MAATPSPGVPPPATRAGDTGPRPWWRAVGFGLLAGVLVGFALVGLVAAPLYLWAQATEPDLGLQRPIVRNGLRIAPLLGLVAFLTTAILSARWRFRDLANGPSQNDRHGELGG